LSEQDGAAGRTAAAPGAPGQTGPRQAPPAPAGAGRPSGGPSEAGFPRLRLRRLRASEGMRRLVRETDLDVAHLILPLFVVPGRGVRRPIGSLPGHSHLSPDTAAAEAEAAWRDGVPAVLLFGQPEPGSKDELGSGAYDDAGAVQSAIRAIKAAVPDLVVITDVCLDAYTVHGHCGVVRGERVDNDETLPLLARTAVSHARAGADVVAPSDMMDGRVGAIRSALDEAGLADTAVLAYAAKFASAFYGPFREAENSAPAFGDRRSYQLDPADGRQALREVELDVAEGADMIMVKPALPYLDVLRAVRERWDLPLFAYNVSGEYAAVVAAAQRGWIDERAAALESLTAIRRAGADAIITYRARQAAAWLRDSRAR
jgi:porphobilinogen synthase